MPTLQYIYIDPAIKPTGPPPKPRPVGWRAWWNGSPYANPVSGLIDRTVDGLGNIWSLGGAPQAYLPIKVTGLGFEVHLPDGEVNLFLMDEVSDIVFHFYPDHHGRFSEEDYTYLQFVHQATTTRYPLANNRMALLECIELLLEQRVPFKEYAYRTRSFRLKTNLMYKDIQDMKRKYGIIW